MRNRITTKKGTYAIYKRPKYPDIRWCSRCQQAYKGLYRARPLTNCPICNMRLRMAPRD
jgi:hypothetical protein